jgi:phosphatidylserine/phosphatidylglycerophosphate/cardiolipin synthase-like enzyme
VITGSYNFTGSAEKDNDENLVIAEDPALARAYLDEFERVYTQVQTPTRCR